MNDLKIDLPEGIDFSNPSTITRSKIQEYFDEIKFVFGNFCGDCEHLNNQEKCDKGCRPRKYAMMIGPFDSVILKKYCDKFELASPPELDEEGIKRGVSRALDCGVQQYG